MTYHYRQVPHEKREDLIEKAKKLIVDGGFKVVSNCSNKGSWAVNLYRDVICYTYINAFNSCLHHSRSRLVSLIVLQK